MFNGFYLGLSIQPRPVRLLGDHCPESLAKEDTMKYMLLINLGPKARDWKSMSEEDQKAIAAGWQAINQTPGVTPGNQLQPPETATTVRAQDGRTLTTDGPYVETKEALDGYCMFEADDLDAAIELAARIPAVNMGGAIEVRPIVEWSQS
jgi:hypothetical protein